MKFFKLIGALVALFGAVPAMATVTIYFQYNYGAVLTTAAVSDATGVASFGGGAVKTYGVLANGQVGLNCVATAANCYTIAVVGIGAPTTSRPDLTSFIINASTSAATSQAAVLTIYVQQTGLTGMVGQFATSFSSSAPTGSAGLAELSSFVDATQIAAFNNPPTTGVTLVNTVNAPAAISDTLAYVLHFGNGAGSFGEGLSIARVPEPSTWGTMLLGFGLIGAGLRRRGRIAFG